MRKTLIEASSDSNRKKGLEIQDVGISRVDVVGGRNEAGRSREEMRGKR